jgi:hypothetical protein
MRTKIAGAIAGAIAGLALCGAATQVSAAALTVGPRLQFQTVRAAVAASHDGDTIYVQAGTYLNDGAIINTKIRIVGVGGMAHFVADRMIGNGKAFFVTNTNVNFDHIEFSGAKVADHNGAGIRYQGGNLTITNCYFHDNQEGILGASIPGGSINIDDSEFAHNGYGTGQTHNIYIGAIHSLTITDSYIHDAVVGHEIKSRAAITTVENSRIVDGTGSASYSIDLPNGGIAIVKNNLIQQGANSQNSAIISYGEEKSQPQWASSQLRIENNTVINERANPRFVVNDGTETAAITNNKFFGLTAGQIASGPNVQSSNAFLTAKPSIDTSHPWEASPRDNIGTVSFLDNLLGSQALSSPGAFVGFDNPTGLIGAALIADTGANASVVTVDNLQVQPVPEPPALPLFVTGLGMMALLAWRRKRKAWLGELVRN